MFLAPESYRSEGGQDADYAQGVLGLVGADILNTSVTDYEAEDTQDELEPDGVEMD